MLNDIDQRPSRTTVLQVSRPSMAGTQALQYDTRPRPILSEILTKSDHLLYRGYRGLTFTMHSVMSTDA